MRKAQLYFHTLRYLKPVQLWGRVTFRLLRPKLDLRPAPAVRRSSRAWQTPAARRVSMLSPTCFHFLNLEHEIPAPADWNSLQLPKLWLYNLHYFDDLNAEGTASRAEWHRDLIARWIAENPPGQGTGWEPYPLSLRIINWIKWALAGNTLNEVARHSLAVQVRFLTQRLERHLLGNHLFANAKALVFAGCYFGGDEADAWLRLGMGILNREIPEQILADGGHFERSTMYHALAYEDMLDLLNLVHADPSALSPWQSTVASWPEIIGKMGGWLHAMSHPDGEIAFFNDAAIGIAPSPSALFAYATRLGLSAVFVPDDVVHLAPSGYIRVSLGPAALLIDAAPIGPDYLPGHAHADTLSYELSLFGQRVVVNSGTSRYGLGLEREWERSTAAHSTVEVDGQDSSEVWAGFRVARRAYPFDISVTRDGDTVMVEAAHSGYRHLPGRVVHRRRWIVHATRLEVLDIIEGEFAEAVSRIYFHPDLHITTVSASGMKHPEAGMAQWQGHRLDWQSEAATVAVKPSSWAPEFGLKLDNVNLELTASKGKVVFALSW
ncbi:heparinase [Candidatus Kaiserbacteria bacterium]|nr:heparinase [Candidatus Kaiserbacteria bacterium]